MALVSLIERDNGSSMLDVSGSTIVASERP